MRRIFREYVAGKGPQKIAADLNRDGIPSPTGKRWNDTTIRGNRTVSSGILNCELYVGVIRWNRQGSSRTPTRVVLPTASTPKANGLARRLPSFVSCHRSYGTRPRHVRMN